MLRATYWCKGANELGRVVHRAVARFRRDTAGVTAIEFALVSIPFLGVLMAIFQAGLFFFASEGLEAAVQDASRNMMTGNAQGAGISTAGAFLSNYVCPVSGRRKLPSFVDCSKLIVDVRVAATFPGADTSADFYAPGSQTKFCPGAPGDIVVVRVIYPLPMFAPVILGSSSQRVSGQLTAGFVSNVAGSPGWRQLLLGTAVFQNEPYSAPYTPPANC